MKTRLVLPDLWRATAVLAMVVYHFLFLAWIQFDWPVNVLSGFWREIGRLAGWSFLFLAGWSLWLAWNYSSAGLVVRIERSQRRVRMIAAWAGVITLTSLMVFPSAPIWWGVLHCLAFSLWSANELLARGKTQLLLFMGFTIWIIGGAALVLGPIPGFWSLVPLGFPPADYRSLDYYPLIPYLGLVWMGVGLGERLTQWAARSEPFLSPPWPGKSTLLWIGQHSLTIYLTHIPILWILLWLFDRV